ncbi:MAG: HEAT repeat domain-containing protein [Actinomycetota bacterium]|nr:HEAT repeat domain-containing protein [Actinomycetota bacterium]
MAISRTDPSEDSAKAIGEALPAAARDGAFQSTREALRRLAELGEDPALSISVERARMTLHDPEILAEVCRAPMTDSDAAMAGEILMAAGTAGAEALINCLATSNPAHKSLLHPVLRGMGESFLAVSSRVVQGEDAPRALSVLDVLPTMGDRRAVSVIEKALANLDVTVRLAAVTSLAIIPDPGGQTALAKALGHWDPQTQRKVVTEIGRIRSSVAIPALVRILEDINFFERNHELKKEVIKSLESIGSADALPILRRVARRKLMFGKKNKELRFLAKKAVTRLSQDATEPQGAIRRD